MENTPEDDILMCAGFIQNLFLYLVFEFLGFELQTSIFEVSHNFMELNHKY